MFHGKWERNKFLDVENFEKKRIKLHKNFTGSY